MLCTFLLATKMSFFLQYLFVYKFLILSSNTRRKELFCYSFKAANQMSLFPIVYWYDSITTVSGIYTTFQIGSQHGSSCLYSMQSHACLLVNIDYSRVSIQHTWQKFLPFTTILRHGCSGNQSNHRFWVAFQTSFRILVRTHVMLLCITQVRTNLSEICNFAHKLLKLLSSELGSAVLQLQ